VRMRKLGTQWRISASPFAPACTRVRWRWWTAMCAASRYISRRASWHSRDRSGSRIRRSPAAGAGSGLAFDDRGSHELKGVTDRWPVLAVNDAPCSSPGGSGLSELPPETLLIIGSHNSVAKLLT
jgi:hypothetical protein